MRIHRIAIANFRGVESCSVDLPADGVAIIQGPNEAGKSSLAEAVDLLFEYPDDSKHKRVRDVQPVHADAGPEVTVELTTGPYRVRYAKRWLRQPKTELTIHAPRQENLVAREAHDRMEAILDETLDRDLYHALRVFQGERLDQGDLGKAHTLTGALERAATGEASDPQAGDSLFSAIAGERERYVTPNGKRRKDREDLERELHGAEARVREAAGKLAGLESLGEQLREVQRELATIVSQLEPARIEHEVAEDGSRKLDDLRAALEREAATRRNSALHVDAAAGRLRERQRLASAAECAKIAFEASAATLSTAENALVGARTLDEEARARREAAAGTMQRCRDAHDLARGDLEYLERMGDNTQLSHRVRVVDEARAREIAARKDLEVITVSDATRADVSTAEERLIRARAAHDAGSPMAWVTALADVDITLDEVPVHLDAGESRKAPPADRVRIEVPGTLRIELEGPAAAGNLQAELDEAQRALDELVARHRLDASAPVRAVDAALRLRESAQHELHDAAAQRDNALIDLTIEELAAKAARAGEFVETYPSTRAAGSPIPVDLDIAHQAVSDASRALEDAAATLREADERVHTLESDKQERALAAATARECVRRDEADERAARVALEREREESPDDDLATALAAAQRELEDAIALDSAARAALDAADPEGVELRMRNATALLDRLNREHANLRERRAQLEGALLASETDDLQYRLDEAQLAVETLATRHTDVERRAAAAILLHDTFARHRDATRRAYVAPYRHEVEKLARLVYGPEVAVEIDPDTLAITARALSNIRVPFDSLSTGTREQLGVLARLACAILVNSATTEDGDAGAPVILDDALGYTDPERLRDLAPAFSATARCAQVIVMTSTPERFGHVGNATAIRLV